MSAAAPSAYANQADHAILICSGGCGSERSWSLFAFADLIFAAINFAPARGFATLLRANFMSTCSRVDAPKASCALNFKLAQAREFDVLNSKINKFCPRLRVFCVPKAINLARPHCRRRYVRREGFLHSPLRILRFDFGLTIWSVRARAANFKMELYKIFWRRPKMKFYKFLSQNTARSEQI